MCCQLRQPRRVRHGARDLPARYCSHQTCLKSTIKRVHDGWHRQDKTHQHLDAWLWLAIKRAQDWLHTSAGQIAPARLIGKPISQRWTQTFKARRANSKWIWLEQKCREQSMFQLALSLKEASVGHREEPRARVPEPAPLSDHIRSRAEVACAVAGLAR